MSSDESDQFEEYDIFPPQENADNWSDDDDESDDDSTHVSDVSPNNNISNSGDDFDKLGELLNKIAKDKNRLELQITKLKAKMYDLDKERGELKRSVNKKDKKISKIESKIQVYENKCLFVRNQIFNDIKNQMSSSQSSNENEALACPNKKQRLTEANSSSYSEKVSENVASRENPMLNDLVIRTVLESLPVRSLLNCRLVCKKWDNEATNQLLKKAAVTVNAFNIDNLPTYSTLLRAPSALILNNYKLSGFNFRDLPLSLEDNLNACLPPLRSHIKLLTLDFENDQLSMLQLARILSEVPNLEVLQLILSCTLAHGNYGVTFYQDLNLKQLKDIQLTIRCDCQAAFSNLSYTFISDFYSIAPNLKSFMMEPFQSLMYGNSIGKTVTEALVTTQKPLTHLTLNYPLGEEGTNNLIATNNFNFTLLVLRDAGKQILLSFLRKQVNLNTLHLLFSDEGWVKSSNELVSLIKLNKNLKYLTLSCFEDVSLKSIRCTFTIQRKQSDTSKTKVETSAQIREVILDTSLLLSDECLDYGYLFAFSDEPLVCNHGLKCQYPSVEAISIKNETFKLEPLLRCITLFPNVQVLEIAPSSQLVMHGIWKYFPELTKLTLHFNSSGVNYDIESGLTGISSAECQSLRNDPIIINFMGEYENSVLDHMRTKPSIIQLTKLRKIIIHMDADSTITITDLTIFLCFMKMSSLSFIKINSYEGPNTALQALKDKFPSAEIIINNNHIQ